MLLSSLGVGNFHRRSRSVVETFVGAVPSKGERSTSDLPAFIHAVFFIRDTVIQRLDLSLKFTQIKTGIVPHVSLKSQVISLFDISKNVDSELN